ncbi:MAG: aminotransferase class I/II-fold pyridoxal phosphate-dependent enzyme [Chloroflexota bacterium]|nr:aminotransferase class I/II-fold pyridoxal phosphate-dependent enzyme [Chloroflexota bacterium]MDE3192612.1 aminotransferase class I/II-fold pyridoxal phosphate-dependent enzyme [Chloroflexota bacterium]
MTIVKRALTNERVTKIPASGIRRFFDMVSGVEGSISLGVGEPDFVTPERFRQAAIRSIDEGHTHYTSNYGIKPLREAIAEHTARLRGLRYDPATEILVTVGVSEAVDLALRATLNDGDEVIVADPSYVAYVPGIVLAGGVPVPVATDEASDFRLLPEDVERAVTPRTRAILLGFPNNPTGAVLEARDVEGIAGIAREHDLLVYSDEIYDRLVYGTEHRSIAAEPGMKERSVYLAGFSKSYAMTGWRVGYACAPAAVIEQMMKIHQYTVMCVPTSGQYAALEALRSGEPEVGRMVAEYDARRRVMWSRFNAMGLHCFEPRGAFYCFPSVSSTGLDDEEFAARLFKEEKVVVVPGSAFGERGKGHIRACYATSMERIHEACDRIERFVNRNTR